MPQDADALAGKAVFLRKQCAACHTVRGTPAAGTTGPDLTHVGSRRTIGAGLLETTRGRGGGMRLLKDAKDINVGDVVRQTETDFNMVECFDPLSNQCGLSQNCRLKGLLHEATASYLAVLDGATLEDLLSPVERTVQMPISQKNKSIPRVPG